jgi:hypothetical protein
MEISKKKNFTKIGGQSSVMAAKWEDYYVRRVRDSKRLRFLCFIIRHWGEFVGGMKKKSTKQNSILRTAPAAKLKNAGGNADSNENQ